jgi:hypothetical protein
MIPSASGASEAVTLYTSLPPRSERLAAGREFGAAYQRECIASWRRQGFDVVSLNSHAEIETLSPLRYGVTFREVTISPPRIIDFLAVIKEEPAAVAGIINADCMMIANDPTISLVLRSARQGLVLVERLNIGADDLRATGTSCFGFDLLLFTKQVLDDLEFDPEISIGTPWWDYWFPIAYHLAGGQLFSAPAPLLLHLNHPQGWSQDCWLTHGRKMHDSLTRNRGSDSSFPFVKHDQTSELSESEVGEFAIAAFQWFKTVPPVIEMEEPSAWLWCSFLGGIDSVSKQVKESERRLEEAKRGFEESERRLKDSFSWKVTRPLRGIEKSLSRIRLSTLMGFLKRLMGA